MKTYNYILEKKQRDLRTSKKLKALAEMDNKDFGDYRGVKCSIKDENQTFSDSYMHDYAKYED